MNAYERKTGLARSKISQLMDKETWMNANKAIEYLNNECEYSAKEAWRNIYGSKF